MKKLSLILLVIAFALGFAGQGRAEFTANLDKDAFAGDYKIDFNELAGDIDCSGMYVPIANQYEEQYGVSFSGVVFADKTYPPYYMPDSTTNSPVAASNFNTCTYYEEIDIEGEPITVFFDPAVTRVGFDGFSYEGEITVTAFRGGVAMEPVTQDASATTFIGVEDTDGIDAIQIEATGHVSAKLNVFFIDNLTFGGTLDTGPAEETPVYVTLNIKPPNCLYARIPINVESRGVTPAVIINDGTYDVNEIDLTTLRLQGVEPLDYALEDASECGAVGGDGDFDLTLKFDTKSLADGIKNSLEEGDTLKDGDIVSLSLTGNLNDGTAIELKEEVNVIVSVKGKHEKHNKGRVHPFDPHSRHDRGHHKGWDHNRGHHKGWDKHR